MKITVRAGAFDPAALLADAAPNGGQAGAIVSFIGLARADQGVSTRLFLDAYPGFTEAQITETADTAIRRFGLVDLIIHHRVGEILPGEAIVLVAAIAVHRREAFEGADYMMDYLKTSAPFWKKESGEKGEAWIEPTARDNDDLARWTRTGADS